MENKTKTAEKTTKPTAKKVATKTTAATEKKQTASKPEAKTTTPAKTAVKPTEKKTATKPKPAEKQPDLKAATKAATEKKQAATKTETKQAEEKVPEKKPAAPENKKHVLFVASEAWPFAGTGGLGEVIGSLPSALNKLGNIEARVIIPLYENLPAEYREKLTFKCAINVPLSWRNQYCGLLEYVHNGVTFWFVDNEYYFKRQGLYGYGDDGERFAFFSRAVCELLPVLDWRVDVLHCNDWHTALVPVYYKLYTQYRENLGGIKTIFTIHNIEYQGQFSGAIIEDLFGISHREYMSVEHNGCINLMKAAIDYSDGVSTVSKTYAQEIMTGEYAHGLENVLRKNAYKLRGILNGIDTVTYNPAENRSLFVNYDLSSVDTLKAANKEGLQRMLNLPVDPDVPMIAMITRLVSHKGVDIVRSAFEGIMRSGVQFVVLGTGDQDHENFFKHMEHVFGNRVRAVIAFNKDMAQKIYAGADIFLMPSRSEPCGLSQMMAMRYGTVPVVRACGGLKDSVIDCGDGDTGNGFTFNDYNAGALGHAVDRAVGLCRDYRDKWTGLRRRAMQCDFSWEKSAKDYNEYYSEILR